MPLDEERSAIFSSALTSLSWVDLSSAVSWALVSVKRAVVALSEAVAVARFAIAAIVSSSNASLLWVTLFAVL